MNSGRIEFDRLTQVELSRVLDRRNELPKISAIYRVKNGSLNIKNAVYSITPLCSEIIIVDNGSTDNTLDVLKNLKYELEGIVDIKIFNYRKSVRIAGMQPTEHDVSLSQYYDYCFSLGNSEYLMKCDAHCYFIPRALSIIQERLNSRPKAIYFRGVEIYGKKLSNEAYLFRKDSGFFFKEGEKYEELVIPNKGGTFKRLRSTIFEPCFIHFKRYSYIKHLESMDPAARIYNK